MLNSINLSLNIHTYWRMSIQEWRHSLSWQEYCRKMALPISSLWGWPQLKKTTMFWLSPTYRGILILVSKGPVSPNCRQCWTSYIALHGIHRTGQGLDHHSTSPFTHSCFFLFTSIDADLRSLPSWTSWLLHIISGSASRQALLWQEEKLAFVWIKVTEKGLVARWCCGEVYIIIKGFLKVLEESMEFFQ